MLSFCIFYSSGDRWKGKNMETWALSSYIFLAKDRQNNNFLNKTMIMDNAGISGFQGHCLWKAAGFAGLAWQRQCLEEQQLFPPSSWVSSTALICYSHWCLGNWSQCGSCLCLQVVETKWLHSQGPEDSGLEGGLWRFIALCCPCQEEWGISTSGWANYSQASWLILLNGGKG